MHIHDDGQCALFLCVCVCGSCSEEVSDQYWQD